MPPLRTFRFKHNKYDALITIRAYNFDGALSIFENIVGEDNTNKYHPIT
jgi:hypothetical protein